MAVAILNVSANRVMFANSDFRALLGEANFPIDTFLKIVVDATGHGVEIAGPMIAKKIGEMIGQTGQSISRRVEALHYLPLGDDGGNHCVMVVESRDELHDILAPRTLSQNYLDLALEASGIGAWSLDLATERADRTPLHDGIFGYETPAPDWNLGIFLSHVHEKDVERVRHAFRVAESNCTEWKFTCRIRRTDGGLRWIEASGHPHGPGDQTISHYIGVVRDITDDVNAAEQRRLLFAELHHRVRNNLAIVQSLVSNTLGNSTETRSSAIALRQRVLALSHAHDFLVATSNQPVTLSRLLDKAIGEYAERRDVEVTGEDIQVPANHVVPLSMWLTELVARSSWHRVLDVSRHSHTHADVILTWTDEPDGQDAWLDHFGSTLVFRSLPVQLGGTITHTQNGQSFVATLVLTDFFKQPIALGEQKLTATTMVPKQT